jgi:hypothetical protein
VRCSDYQRAEQSREERGEQRAESSSLRRGGGGRWVVGTSKEIRGRRHQLNSSISRMRSLGWRMLCGVKRFLWAQPRLGCLSHISSITDLITGSPSSRLNRNGGGREVFVKREAWTVNLVPELRFERGQETSTGVTEDSLQVLEQVFTILSMISRLRPETDRLSSAQSDANMWRGWRWLTVESVVCSEKTPSESEISELGSEFSKADSRV